MPRTTDIILLNGMPEDAILSLAATAERYSEHPLAEAVRSAALIRKLELSEPKDFQAVPGMGVRATVNGSLIAVGNRLMMPVPDSLPITEALEKRG